MILPDDDHLAPLTMILSPRTLRPYRRAVAILLAAMTAAAAAEPPQASTTTAVPPPVIHLIQPGAGESFGPVRRLFAAGHIAPATGTLTINGLGVDYTTQGQFLKTLEVQPGTFTVSVLLTVGESSAAVRRDIPIAAPTGPPAGERAEILPVEPSTHVALKAGDWLRAAAWARPGGRMRFQVKGLTDDIEMPELAGPSGGTSYAEFTKEVSAPGGFYAGAVHLDPERPVRRGEVEFKFEHPRAGKAKARAPGRVDAERYFWRVARVTAKAAPARAGPEDSMNHFFPQGTRLLLDGRIGNRWRIRLSPPEEAWIEEKHIELLPEGTPPASARLETIIVRSSETHTEVDFMVNAPVPATVSVEPGGEVKVSFHQTRANTDWIVYDETDPLVREVRWKQESSEKVSALIRLDPAAVLWGWSLRRQSDRATLILRQAPRRRGLWAFEGLTVILDPGHGPDTGTVGSLATLERDVAFALARRVKERIERRGARVVMTRASETDPTSLQRRPEIAVESGGDVFLSLHFNSLPQGVDPRQKPRGFSTFYYHPQSLELARAMQFAFRASLPIPSEGLRFGNYLVVRMADMPAVLIEAAYLLLPEQESLILDPDFQDKLARSIADGLRAFLDKSLRPQESGPAKRRGR